MSEAFNRRVFRSSPYSRGINIQDLLEELVDFGFDWNQLQIIFPFNDSWSEGEYAQILDAALRSIKTDAGKNDLLAMLDLQYAVLLEQSSVQLRHCNEANTEFIDPIFGERVMAYLEINSNSRKIDTKSARTAMFEISPGQMWQRLMGSQK